MREGGGEVACSLFYSILIAFFLGRARDGLEGGVAWGLFFYAAFYCVATLSALLSNSRRSFAERIASVQSPDRRAALRGGVVSFCFCRRVADRGLEFSLFARL